MSPSDQHVQYVLLAEFDIDKGASLKYQLPTETGTDEHILSELMLPDGAHLRAEDWTIFCLNQKIPDPDADHNSATAQDEEREKPLLYVLNLVRTKLDATARRGAHVKSMAICTRHQFLHIYKPVLLLAMERYFEKPSREVLESLYRAVNDMDLSRMPRLSWHERQILRSTDDKTMFEELFIDDNEKPAAGSPSAAEPWTTDGEEEFEGLRKRRGTLIDLTSGSRVLNSVGKDRHFYETKIDYEGIKLPIRVPLTVNNEEVGDFSLINLIRTFSPPPSHPGSPNPHHPHLDSPGTHTHPIILLLNALLTQKRIVFLGYGHPSGEVANYVLAACALGSGCGTVLRGFTERAFPYTNLTSVDDLLKCPGFIAGVTNPTYEEHTAWWDVLCNISTGKITVSKDIQVNYGRQSSVSSPPIDADSASFASLSISRGSSAANYNKERDMDTEFMNDVMNAIQSHYSETAIRAKFQDYVSRFVRLAALYEEDVYQQTKIGWETDPSSDPTGLLGHGSVFPDEASRQRELSLNASRIEGWRQTISYRYYQKDFAIWKQNTRLKNLDVYRQICKLKILRDIPEVEIIVILDAFRKTLISDQHIIEFLSFLPQHQGGLSPLGLCLFHSSPKVRHAAVQLFNKISTNPTGMKFIQRMSKFQRMAYDRQCWLDASNGDSSIYSHNPSFYPM